MDSRKLSLTAMCDKLRDALKFAMPTEARILIADTYHGLTAAALAQQAQPLADEAFDEDWAASGRNYGEDELEQVRLGWRMARDRMAQQAQPEYRCGHGHANGCVCVRCEDDNCKVVPVVQQAQPLTDAEIEAEAAEFDGWTDRERWFLKRGMEIARDRMAEQAPPNDPDAPCNCFLPNGGHVETCWKRKPQQAQPLTDRARDEAFEELRRSALRMAAECDDAGCAASNMIRILITAYDVRAAEARDRMAQRAQPEMPTRGQIAEAIVNGMAVHHQGTVGDIADDVLALLAPKETM